ncbi:MAG: hypothetical protein ACOYIR_05575 [Christensenellales bacterium]
MRNKRGISEYLTMGVVIGLFAAAGIMLGILLSNLLLWLLVGAGVGVVVGAVAEMFRRR